MSYAFRDTPVAARRLELVADVFEPATRALLRRAAGLGPFAAAPRRRVLDLGCAHGRTTALLAEVLGGEPAVGVDQSPAFLALAARRGDPRLAFLRADVTAPPFPAASFGVVFCRFLLSHLGDPATALARWAGLLAPGGLLLVEEVETIRTPDGPLRRYLEIVDEMLAARGHALYVGSRLAAAVPAELDAVTNDVLELRVPAASAARMFALNLEAWGDDEVAVARHGRATLDRLAAELAAARDAPPGPASPGRDAVWGLRHLVLRCAGEGGS